MVTKNIIQRVFFYKYKDNSGTCFTFDYKNKQYIITAKHIINNISNNDSIKIFNNNQWVSIKSTLIGHHEYADISVLSLDQIISSKSLLMNIDSNSSNLIYSQDVYFLGFPFGITNDKSISINNNNPFPFVRKAILSSIQNDKESNCDFFYLDGTNNPGFSGSPVVYHNGMNNNDNELYFGGVISGYLNESIQIFDKNNFPTDLHINLNTNLIKAYPIKYAIELINNNPNGVDL